MTSALGRYRWFAVASGMVVLGVGAARYGRSPELPITAPAPPMEDDAGLVAWCAPGLEPIAGGGCFAPASPSAKQPAPLVVYLHGRFERSAPEEEQGRQRRLAEHAAAKGFAVLALRGREGQCLQPELARWVCWPASERSVDAGPGYVTAWEPALREAEARTGKGKRYVLGFSSGGYFAVILATRGLLEADAFAIAGAGPIEPTRARDDAHKTPLLLLSADDDPSQPDMMLLSDELTRERWAHDEWSRGGGHDLLDPDIDAALTFFARAGTEPLPLRPPLGTHVPRARDPNARDAAPSAPPDEPDEASKPDNPYDTADAEP
jgi:predicted esterase